MLQSHHASAVPLVHPQGSLRNELGLLRALVTALREEVAALRLEAGGTVGAKSDLEGARGSQGSGRFAGQAGRGEGEDATEGAVTAGHASVPVVAVSAKANEDGVMEPGVVAAEKAAMKAATFSEREVEDLVEKVGDVHRCRSSAGTASADGAVVGEPINVGSTDMAVDVPSDRFFFWDEMHTGEVLHVSEDFALVWPLGPLPSEVESAISMASEGGRRLLVLLEDVEEDGLVLYVCTKVRFKCYKDHSGVGAHQVTSA